jgi:hypothetical protein
MNVLEEERGGWVEVSANTCFQIYCFSSTTSAKKVEFSWARERLSSLRERFEVPNGLSSCHWNTLFQRPTGLEVLQFLLDIATGDTCTKRATSFPSF